MTTDITELAQREKFEAWWERTQHNGNAPRFGWSHWRDGEGYKVDDDDSELDGMWSAWKAAGAELVEALEKAQRYIEELREWNAGLAQESFERQQRIDELEESNAQVIQSRDHYKRMTAEGLKQLAESRTVTLSKSDIFNVPGGETYVGGEMIPVDTLRDYLTEHGIKWEAE